MKAETIVAPPFHQLYFHRSELEAWVKEGKVKTYEEIQSEAATYTMRKELKKGVRDPSIKNNQ